MKKRLLVLGMIACLFGLTACGNNESAQVLTEEEEAAAQVADSYISQIAQIEADGTADQYIAYDESLESVFSSWESVTGRFSQARTMPFMSFTLSNC